MNAAFKLVGLLSRTPETPEGSAKLVTIAWSHYCERARWALDLSPLRDTYIEDAHPPVFHIKPVVAYSKDKRRTGTPLLVFSDGTILHDSGAIVHHLSRAYPKELGHLYPPGLEDKVLELEKDFSARLGVQSRRLAYWTMATERAAGTSTANPAGDLLLPRVEAWLWWAMEGNILPRMLEVMGITEATAAAALADCKAVFAQVSAMLAEPRPDGTPRRYILGTDRMTAADLTFAALAYPLLSPPQFASVGFGGDDPSPWVAKARAKIGPDFIDTPAGQLALRLYSEERYLDRPYGALKIRTTNRNKWPWQTSKY